jgi:hypothetical protein
MLEDRWVPSTLTVTNTLDSGAGSLRAAIANASNAPKTSDTIVFAPSLNGQTITLTSGELLITSDVTIAGPGTNLTISGNHASRVFEFTGKTKHDHPQVSLSGMTISNGNTGVGGAIDNDGTLTISNCIFSFNSAGSGGAIDNAGTLTVNGCALTDNSATVGIAEGGAIANVGTLTVIGCTLSGNSAGNTGTGGAIVNNGTLTISDSILSVNSAFKGGGIYSRNGTINLSGCTLTDNSATFLGGGIFIGPYATATVSGSVVGPATVGGTLLPGNSAVQGGGIYVDGGILSAGTLTVTNSSKITGNTAPAGSGPDVYNLGTLYLDSTSIMGMLDGNPARPI